MGTNPIIRFGVNHLLTHSATSTLTSIKSFESRKEIRALIKLPTIAMQTVDVSGRKLRKKSCAMIFFWNQKLYNSTTYILIFSVIIILVSTIPHLYTMRNNKKSKNMYFFIQRYETKLTSLLNKMTMMKFFVKGITLRLVNCLCEHSWFTTTFTKKIMFFFLTNADELDDSIVVWPQLLWQVELEH